MKTAEHTPGPWARHSKWWQLIVPASHAERPIGASVDVEKDLAYYAQSVCRLTEKDRHKPELECLANARLISAAPEMLAALKAVVAIADRKTTEFDAARAAIDKAEGRA